MKHTLKRSAALLLALLLCLSLCACGGEKPAATPDGDGATSTSAPTEKELEKKLKGVSKVRLDHVYTMDYLDFQLPENAWGSGYSVVGDTVYLACSYSRSYEKDGESFWENGMQLYAIPLSGGEAALLLEKPSDNEYNEEECWNRYSNIGSMTVAADGTLWYSEDGGYSNWSDEENYVYENYSSIVHADQQGNELGRVNIRDLLAEDEWFYVSRFLFLPDGGILLSGDGFLALNPDLTLRYRAQQDSSNGWLGQLVQTGSGALIGNYYSYTELGGDTQKIVEINPADGSVTELCDLPFTYASQFLAGPGDTLVLGSGGSLYSFNYRTGEKTELVNWLNSDINYNRIGSVYPLEDGRMLVQEYTRSWESSKLGILRPNADVVEKYVIRFAANSIDDSMQESVIDYNKQNDTFRIVFEDYSQYNTNEDYKAGIAKLNQDIVSGNIPDMFLMSGLPYDTYAAKGLLLDLTDRISSAYDMNDFVSNVFDALRYNGRIYSLVPSFGVTTVAAKRSYVGEKPGWTMEDLKALMQQHPEAQLFEGVERSQMLTLLLTNTIDSYIDRNTGTCSFNSASFIALLELVKSFPETFDWSAYYGDDYDWQAADSQFRDGKTLLSQQSLYNYSSVKYIFNQFGNDLTYIGLPTAEGVGSSFEPQLEIAISARTKLDDACWDFIKYLLSEDYQNELTWGFPVRISALQAQQEAAMTQNEDQLYYDYAVVNEPVATVETVETAEAEVAVAPLEAATPAEMEVTEDIMKPLVIAEEPDAADGGEVTADGEPAEDIDIIEEPAESGYYDYWSKPLTQEMADIVNDAIYSCTTVSRDRSDVQAIIEEEAGAFFSGQKTARQVADIIQSRVSLYVAESM